MKSVSSILNKYKNMSLKSKAALWYVVCSVIQRSIAFLSSVLFTRLLTKAEIGIIGVYNTWMSVVMILASLNLASGVYLRGLIKYDDDKDEFTTSLNDLFIVVFLIAFGVYLLFSGFWSDLLKLPRPYMIAMFVDIFFSVLFHFWSARRRVAFEYRSLIIVTITNAVCKLGFQIIAIFLFSDNVKFCIFAMMVADVLVFGFALVEVFKSDVKWSVKYWKYALRYNLPLVPHYLSQIVLNQSDRVMIRDMCGADYSGVYTTAYSVASVMTIINQSIINSFSPWMYQCMKTGDYDEVKGYSLKITCVVAGFNLALIIIAPEFLMIFPKSYNEALWIIPPVTMSVFFMFLYNLFSNVEFYFEKNKFMMVASVSGALMNIVLNYIFINKYGFLAAGYTTLACYLCYSIGHYIVMKIILRKELNSKKVYNESALLIISLAFICIGFLVMMLYKYWIIRYTVMLIMLIVAIINRKFIIGVFKKKTK